MQKKHIFLAFFLIFLQYGFSQISYSESQIRNFIEEVYAAQSEDLVFQNPERHKVINMFFLNINIELRNDIDINKKFNNLKNDLQIIFCQYLSDHLIKFYWEIFVSGQDK